jgi:hypothetical protein
MGNLPGVSDGPVIDGTASREQYLRPLTEEGESATSRTGTIVALATMGVVFLIVATAFVTARLTRAQVMAELAASRRSAIVAPSAPAPAASTTPSTRSAVAMAAATETDDSDEAAALAEDSADSEPEMTLEPELVEPRSDKGEASHREKAAGASSTPAHQHVMNAPAPKSAEPAPKRADFESEATASAAKPAPKAAEPASSAPVSEVAVVAPTEKKATAASSDEECDEVLCLVEGRGCCGKDPSAMAAATSAKKEKKVDPSLPERLSRTDISRGLKPFMGRLSTCGLRNELSGAVTVKLKIAADGTISSMSSKAGNAEFDACAGKVLERANFGEAQSSTSLSYPIIIR